VDGAVSTLEIDLVNDFTPQIGDQFTVMTDASPFAGDFDQITSNNCLFTYTVNYGASHNIVEISVTSVPEPGAISLLAIGGIALIRRRRKSAVRAKGK
jgi:hypothetical protein